MSTTLVQTPPKKGGGSPSRYYLAAAILLLVVSAVFRQVSDLDTTAESLRVRDTSVGKVVGGDWFAGMLLGFREMVADLMWIQVDSYFHEGRYDKILPVCYVITAMDPNWIDVYSVGAWHLGYNFGDRRLVPTAIDFDELGVKNNLDSADMWYELGWMEEERGYDFKDAAIDLKKANDLGLRPIGRRHAWPHAVEATGNIQAAIDAWKELVREDPTDQVAKKQIFLANLRLVSRKDLGAKPIQVHFDVKITRKGPRFLHVEGVTNLPLYSRIFFDLKDSDWQQREKQSLAWQIHHYTLFSQPETTLRPQWGMYRGQAYDFYQGVEHLHQGDKMYDQFPSEPVMPVQDGHMVIVNGQFQGDIDMAKNADQYPLESQNYTLTFYVDPSLEPITTQDIIGWHGEGITGPLVHHIDGRNQLIWTHNLTRQDIVGKSNMTP